MNIQSYVDSSDDEMLEDLTKKVKQHLEIDIHRQTYHCTSAQPKEDCDTSLKIVEAKSEPDLTSAVAAKFEKADDNCLEIEKLVSNLDLSQRDVKEELDELFATRGIVNYSLEQGSPELLQDEEGNTNLSPGLTLNSDESYEIDTRPGSSASQYCTPMKSVVDKDDIIFITPSSTVVPKSPSFRTPLNPISIKKPSTVSFKRNKNNFQHIASPIAAYIKNSPQVPLVQDVHPKKPLPGVSMIPKLLKPKHLVFNKENINFPTLAYKTAKSVKIHVSERDKLPQSKSSKIVSSLPKPLVMKHNHRKINSSKKRITANPEDSFANLTLHQADISLCTQKSAFHKPKKRV